MNPSRFFRLYTLKNIGMFYHLLFSYNNTYYISRSDFSTGLQTSLFTNLPTWSCYFMVSAQSKWNLIFPKACFRISLPHLSKWKCHHIFHAKNFIFHSFLSSTTANSSASSINKNSKIYPEFIHLSSSPLSPLSSKTSLTTAKAS